MTRAEGAASPKRRMERHHRRRLDDAPDSAAAIRRLVERQSDENSDDVNSLLPRAPQGLSDRPPFTPPVLGSGSVQDPGLDDDDDDDTLGNPYATTRTYAYTAPLVTERPTTTRMPLATPTRATLPATTSTSRGFFGSLWDDITGDDDETTSSTSTRTSTSTTPTTTSSSTRTSTSSTPRSTSTVNSTPARTEHREHDEPETSQTSSTPIDPVTATRLVTSTPTVSSTPTSDASEANAKSSDGPGAGPIIGIVAGALVGVVALSMLIGFLIKKFKRKDSDPFEANPFDRDAFQRHSTMIPDHFDSDDGHGQPSMSEHHDGFGPSYASGVAAGAGAAMLAHNEGGPRPPTMFARHANGPGAQFDAQQQQQQQQMYNAPQVGAYYHQDPNGDYSVMQNVSPQMDYNAPSASFGNRHLDEPIRQQRSVSPAPQLPPLAAFGGDPYSIAGVGARMNDNIANPYAHLDRGHSGSAAPMSAQPRPDTASSASHGESAGPFNAQHNSAAADALVAGLAHQSQLQQQRSISPAQVKRTSDFDTAGRPGTSEGRSGTPDLPNVQQTYAIGASSDDGHHVARSGSIGGASLLDTARYSASSQDMLNQMSSKASPTSAGGAASDPFAHPNDRVAESGSNGAQNATLSVRNLMPGGAAGAMMQQQQQRPLSTASSFADPDDAYGGVY